LRSSRFSSDSRLTTHQPLVRVAEPRPAPPAVCGRARDGARGAARCGGGGSAGGRVARPFGHSDPDASWGHRSAVSTRKGGGFYGYRVHAAVCARTDLPVAWRVETAGSHESNYVAPLLDTARSRDFTAETTALDMGYDNERVYDPHHWPVRPLRQ
jgi:Transposase DDE domain